MDTLLLFVVSGSVAILVAVLALARYAMRTDRDGRWISAARATAARIFPSATKDDAEDPIDRIGSPADDEKLILVVLAIPGTFLPGGKLLSLLDFHHIEFGDCNIFHAYGEHGLQFSIGNLQTRDRVFDLSSMDRLETPGIELSMNLSRIIRPDLAFERMRMFIQEMVNEFVDVKVCTGPDHQVVSTLILEQYENRVKRFHERRRNPAAKTRAE